VFVYCVDADSHVDGVLNQLSCSGENLNHLKGHHYNIVCLFRRISLLMIGVSDDHIAITDRVDFKDFMNLAFLIKFSENCSEHLHHSLRLILIRITCESRNICEENGLFFKLF